MGYLLNNVKLNDMHLRISAYGFLSLCHTPAQRRSFLILDNARLQFCLKYTLPKIIMDVENHLFVEENCHLRAMPSTSMMIPGSTYTVF